MQTKATNIHSLSFTLTLSVSLSVSRSFFVVGWRCGGVCFYLLVAFSKLQGTGGVLSHPNYKMYTYIILYKKNLKHLLLKNNRITIYYIQKLCAIGQHVNNINIFASGSI